MYRKEACCAVLLTIIVAAQALPNDDNDLLEACDDLQECASDQYLSTLAYETDCWNICGVGNSLGSGSSAASTEYECLACHNLCTSCYGPANSQCYSCASYYIILQQAETTDSIVCDNGTIRNTSLEVRNCVSDCPFGFDISNTTMECSCPVGYYLNASNSCSECFSGCSICVNGTQSGCLQCSFVEHEGQCLEECPSDLVNVNGRCEKATNEELFPINSVVLFALIGTVAVIIVCSMFWLFCVIFICLCVCLKARRNNKYLLTTEDGTTISESFKKVKRKISIKKRPPRPLSVVNRHDQEILNQQQEIVSQSFDPYLQLNAPVDQQPINSGQIEIANRTFLLNDGNHEDHEEEEFYMQMTPVGSVENLPKESSKQHKKVSITQSYEPQPTNAYRTTHSEQRRSMPYNAQQFKDEEQEIYYNNDFQEEDEVSQENYVTMDHPGRHEPEEYLAPSDIMMQNSQVEDDEGGQELYTEMDLQPPVPIKSVVPPATRQNQSARRKETLDNQYVKITGQDQKLKKSFFSNEQLAPKYMNVQRDGDPRLRSVTTPPMSSVPPAKKIEFEIEQPIYQNFANEDQEESYYGNVS